MISMRDSYLIEEMSMVKVKKYFREQAHKAEGLALRETNGEVSQELLNLAGAYRAQADVLKQKKKLKAKKNDK
jgi:hypothetical protein